MVVLYQCYFPDFDDYIWLCRRMPSLQEMQSTLKRVCVCNVFINKNITLFERRSWTSVYKPGSKSWLCH